MVDSIEQFEVTDIEGTTKTYAGTVGTGGSSISFSGKVLQNVLVISNNKNDSSKNLEFRFDAADAWISLGNNCVIGWTPKQSTEILIRGASSNTNYQIIANWEP